MKTIKQWLESIEDQEVREKALANADEVELPKIAETQRIAVSMAFVWSNTPEGLDYWGYMYDNILKKRTITNNNIMKENNNKSIWIDADAWQEAINSHNPVYLYRLDFGSDNDAKETFSVTFITTPNRAPHPIEMRAGL